MKTTNVNLKLLPTVAKALEMTNTSINVLLMTDLKDCILASLDGVKKH